MTLMRSRIQSSAILAIGFLFSAAQLARAQSSSDDGSTLGGVLVLLFCCSVPAAVLVLVVVVVTNNRKPYSTVTQTPYAVERVLQTAVQIYTLDGYQVTSHTQQNVTFAKQTRPNIGFFILLFVLGIIPGIVYWILANKPFSVNVVAEPLGSATTVGITASVTGFGAKQTADRLVQSLSVATSEPIPPTAPDVLPPTTPA